MPTIVTAGLLPQYTVQEMVFSADAVIAGTHAGDGVIRVDEVFRWPDAAAPAAGQTIGVPAVTKLDKTLRPSLVQPARHQIATQTLTLFLKRDGQGQWTLLSTSGGGGQGVIWYDVSGCYWYRQRMNPGPYTLELVNPSSEPGPVDKAALSEAIRKSLKQRSAWEAAVAVVDPAERAARLAAYLLPQTAPGGFLGHSVDLRGKLRELGPAAVPAVTSVLRSARPDEDLNTAVLILYDIGHAHPKSLGPAVEPLCDLLGNDAQAHPSYVLSALRVAADPKAISATWPMIRSENKELRGEAAWALGAMGARECFEQIAGMLEGSDDPKDRTAYTLNLARALYALDPVRAKPLILEAETNAANAGVHHFIPDFK